MYFHSLCSTLAIFDLECSLAEDSYLNLNSNSLPLPLMAKMKDFSTLCI